MDVSSNYTDENITEIKIINCMHEPLQPEKAAICTPNLTQRRLVLRKVFIWLLYVSSRYADYILSKQKDGLPERVPH